MVYYRKYRPQKIDDLDSAQVREALSSILSQDPPHAFLFTGPKGLGKTSTARIIAKVVNCTGRKSEIRNPKSETNAKYKIQNTKYSDIESCNECEQCLSIANGSNLDVLEIDAASNRGIDEIRELKDKIRLAPVAARKKVYIIDEVHMLTTEAFNALLKTLEEPPAHAMFILCTTEAHKVPSTILSRCFHLAFKSATQDELVRAFQRIVKGEKIAIDDDALIAIATLAEGGFRDGTKVLEELVSHSAGSGQAGEKITAAMVEEKYHVAGIASSVVALVKALETKDIQSGLTIIAGLIEQKTDLYFFMQQLIDAIHGMLLKKFGVEQTNTALHEIQFTTEELQVLLELFLKASSDMRLAAIRQLPLELAVIEWGLLKESTPETVTIESTTTVIASNDEVSVASLRKKVGDIQRIKALYGEKTVTTKTVPVTAESDAELLDFTAEGEITKEWMNALWNAIIRETKNHNHTLAGVLRGCMVKSFDRKSLVIETAYKFHKEKLDHASTTALLEKVCKMLTGNQVTISVELRDK